MDDLRYKRHVGSLKHSKHFAVLCDEDFQTSVPMQTSSYIVVMAYDDI